MVSSIYSNMNSTPLRKVEGKVELYNGSTSPTTFLPDGKLQEITVARVGEKGKFFGFGICQQATVKVLDKKVLDKEDNLVFNKGDEILTSFRVGGSGDYQSVCPPFYVKDAVRDEKTSVYTITAYDALDDAVTRVFSDLGLQAPYMLVEVVDASKRVLGLSGFSCPEGFDTVFEKGANLEGTESLRSVLNAVAEVTQTIYYIDHTDRLVFKRLDKSGAAVLDIPKKDYFEFTKSLPVTITKIMHTTELGENLDAGTDGGVCQYIRDNPFWNNITDLRTYLSTAVSRVSGLTIVPFNLKWRGNFLTELCDKIRIETKDGTFVDTFILDDSFTYNGGFSQTTDWEYKPENDRATASTPITVGERINQTFAKVDKVEKNITLYVSSVEQKLDNQAEEIRTNVSELQVNTQNIKASVSQTEQTTQEVKDDLINLNNEIASLSTRVDATITSEDVQIEIRKELSNGTNKVTTSTGFTFNDEGLNVSKEGSEVSTTISENGMQVFKNEEAVLTANNRGVDAANLHATTYLIIGTNSRLEDFGSDRTACFWIGK